MTEPFDPVSRAERIPILDVLRGFALYGVLLAYTFWSLGTAPEETWTPIDRALAWIQGALVDGKFMTLFSFLFGLGFAIFLERASVRAADPVPIYVRRLLVLLAIGLVHAVTLRDGDILAPYAIIGFFLLLFRRASDRAIAVAASLCLLLYPFLNWGLARVGISLPPRPDETGLGWFGVRWAYVRYWYVVNPIAWPYNLGLFLAGMWVGRRRLYIRLTPRHRIVRFALAGFLVGALAFAVRELMGTTGWRLGADLLWTVHCVGLAGCYAALIAGLARPGTGRLAAVGRMALTNYLLQAVLIVPICFVLGLWDRVTPRLAVVLALIVGAFQAGLSVWWLERYRFGPAEWVWRSLTYRRKQPMKIG